MKKQAGEVLKDARLAAMTTTRAVYTVDTLWDGGQGKFDLVVFDESSQVGLAHALALTPLGSKCLFAGDPQQLAPIVRSKNNLAVKWLGSSIFSLQDKIGK